MRLQRVHRKEFPVLFGHEIVLHWPVKRPSLPTAPCWVKSTLLLPWAELTYSASCAGCPNFFLGAPHLATVWDLVRGRAHLPLMKPERPYTLSCSPITTQPPCSWGESMWPRLGQSNIPSLDLELGLGHTRELRWGGLFLAVIETMSSFQGQQGQGDKQWDLVSSAQVSVTSYSSSCSVMAVMSALS